MSNPIRRVWQPMTCAALMCGLVATPTSAAFPVPHKVGPGTTAHHPNHTNHPTAPHPHMANHAMHHHTANGVGNGNGNNVNRANGNGNNGNGNIGNRVNGNGNNGNKGNNANHSATISTLHQIHSLLIKADHDYAGHRAKAVEHVNHAIRELGGQHHHNNSGTGKILGIRVPVNKNGNGNANKLPQAESDAHLRQALQKLSGLNGHVPNTHKAAQHVQSAITELNTALKVN